MYLIASVAVVIPCYRVKNQILNVLGRIGPEVAAVYVVDDACTEGSGDWVMAHCVDARVRLLRHVENRGVGAAVITGYRAALLDGIDIVVKLDGDGQMDPDLIERLIAPIQRGQADFTKGNRFYDLVHLREMPTVRLVGNAVLSLMAKLSTGYWNLFDVNNGFIAIHSKVLRCIPLEDVSERYFFETDMLFRLNTLRAVVVDVPMTARYSGENSSLKIHRIVGEFVVKHAVNLSKRIFYNYFLRDMTVASIELVLGIGLMGFGLVFGAVHWTNSALSGHATPLGTIMLAALPAMLGLQMALAFVAFDVANVPKRPIHPDLF